MVSQIPNGNVEFVFYRPGAGSVCLAGDFNGWNRNSLPMARGPDGFWRCQLRIAPGYYHFRYFSDGEWFLDYAAFGLDHGPYGLNSVLRVEMPAPSGAEPAPVPRRTDHRRLPGDGSGLGPRGQTDSGPVRGSIATSGPSQRPKTEGTDQPSTRAKPGRRQA